MADAVTGENPRELATAPGVIDPRPDPTGRRVAYVSGNALRVVGVDGTGDRALAEPAGPDQACGVAEFIAAEEMGRSRGYWWSPDGTRLLVAFTDKSPVRRWHIADPANPEAAPNVVSYPAAGTDNVEVRLAVLSLGGRRVTRVDVDWHGGELPTWSPRTGAQAGPPLIALQSRGTRSAWRSARSTRRPATRPCVETETDDTWVEIAPGVPAWTPDGRLVRIGVKQGGYRLFVDGQGGHAAVDCRCARCSNRLERRHRHAVHRPPRPTRRRCTSTTTTTRASPACPLWMACTARRVAATPRCSRRGRWTAPGPRVDVLRGIGDVAERPWQIASCAVDPGVDAEHAAADPRRAGPARGAGVADRVRAGQREAAGAARPVRRAARPAGAVRPQRLPRPAVAGRPGVRGADRGRARHARARAGLGPRGRVRLRRRHARGPGRRAAGRGGAGHRPRSVHCGHSRLVLRRVPGRARRAAPPGRVPRGDRGRAGDRLAALRHPLHRAISRPSGRETRGVRPRTR